MKKTTKIHDKHLATASTANYKSPLKWAGGKRRLIKEIAANLPNGNTGRLIEPFVGGGSVFLNLNFDKYLLVDTNPDLINLFTLLKTASSCFIASASKLFTPNNNTEEKYYELRMAFNSTSDPIERSKLFIYLNRHGYNGLCRYNSKGGFNVPFGRYKKPYFPEQELFNFAEKAQRAEFLCADYTKAFELALPGDVIYCDPPYSPISPSSNFTAYSGSSFSDDDQKHLVQCAIDSKHKGVSTLISNHHVPFTKALYKAADRTKLVKVQRSISCKGDTRKKIDEVLASYLAKR